MAIARLPFLLPVLFVVILSPLSHADQSETYIVHVAPSHKPSAFTSHRHWYASLLLSLSSDRRNPSTAILYTYGRAAAGFSARLTPVQAADLHRHPSVLSVAPDRIRHLHTTRTPLFLGLADTFGLWPSSDYAEDVIVGVLDTGIWPERSTFSDDGLPPPSPSWKGVCEESADFPATACNHKIIGARAFYRGYEAYRGRPIDESVESKSPRDTEGHGSHTASTAAGSAVMNASFFEYAGGNSRGMAAKARIAAYKICWKLGCFDSDILAAFDQAIADGVHIISLSVGASGYAPQYYHDAIAIGAFAAAEHGVLVSCSAGNSGPGPYTAVNVAPWIFTVGASTIDREFPADVVLGDGRVYGGVSLYSGDSLRESKIPLVYAGHCGSRYCNSRQLDAVKVGGKIVICDRGGNARVEKGAAVKDAGGAGMILANTAESGEELISDSHIVPATMVGASAGDEIRDYAATGQSPTATIIFRGTVIGRSPSAPRVASFSSRGPNHLTPAILKPDVIGPGVNVLAAWTGFASPTDLDIDPRRVEFNIISGTSMSCPHVSGLAALLRKAHPTWSPAAIKSALMTTAYNLDNSGRIITDLATGRESTPFVRGAGHVDPNRALNPGLIYDLSVKDYVAFLCAIGYDAAQIAVFVRDGGAATDCGGVPGLASPGDLNYPSFSVVFGAGDSVLKHRRVVTNVGDGDDAVYEVAVSSPRSVEISVSPRKLVFSKEIRTLSYEVTFTSLAVGNDGAEFGSIEWADGVHLVRSPVAVRWVDGVAAASSE